MFFMILRAGCLRQICPPWQLIPDPLEDLGQLAVFSYPLFKHNIYSSAISWLSIMEETPSMLFRWNPTTPWIGNIWTKHTPLSQSLRRSRFRKGTHVFSWLTKEADLSETDIWPPYETDGLSSMDLRTETSGGIIETTIFDSIMHAPASHIEQFITANFDSQRVHRKSLSKILMAIGVSRLPKRN